MDQWRSRDTDRDQRGSRDTGRDQRRSRDASRDQRRSRDTGGDRRRSRGQNGGPSSRNDISRYSQDFVPTGREISGNEYTGIRVETVQQREARFQSEQQNLSNYHAQQETDLRQQFADAREQQEANEMNTLTRNNEEYRQQVVGMIRDTYPPLTDSERQADMEHVDDVIQSSISDLQYNQQVRRSNGWENAQEWQLDSESERQAVTHLREQQRRDIAQLREDQQSSVDRFAPVNNFRGGIPEYPTGDYDYTLSLSPSPAAEDR